MRRNQMVGVLGGMIVAAMTANFWPEVREAVGGWPGALLWGAAIGAMLASAAQFSAAGKILTRSENNTLNTVVGVAGFFVTMFLIILLVIGIFWVIGFFGQGLV